MSLCKNCISGVTHEGTPKGKIETIGGIETYVSTPTLDFPKDKAILYLTDGFGLPLINNKLLADDFARNGFKTYVPDLFSGDCVEADALTTGKFNLEAWFPNHTQEKTRPIIDKLMTALEAQGVTKFAAVGYCFGGRYVFDLAFDHKIVVAAVAHPSFLHVPADLEKYAATAAAPLLVNSCTFDDHYPVEAAIQGDEILKGFVPGYKREHFEGCTHGFAVRGDMSIPAVRAGKEGAFKSTVDWFIKYL